MRNWFLYLKTYEMQALYELFYKTLFCNLFRFLTRHAYERLEYERGTYEQNNCG